MCIHKYIYIYRHIMYIYIYYMYIHICIDGYGSLYSERGLIIESAFGRLDLQGILWVVGSIFLVPSADVETGYKASV